MHNTNLSRRFSPTESPSAVIKISLHLVNLLADSHSKSHLAKFHDNNDNNAEKNDFTNEWLDGESWRKALLTPFHLEAYNSFTND